MSLSQHTNTELSPAKTKLVDAQQRSFSYLRLSITDLCNFKCSYCLPNGYQGKRSHELELREIETLIAGFATLGFDKIRLTGGEPSLRKDLNEIIALCKQQQNIAKVCITSNGYNLQKFLPQWIAAGIDQVNISIDSLLPESFKLITASSDLPKIVAAIETAIAADFKSIKINTVLLREHLDEQIIPLINWVKERPISLRFIELMQTGENQAFFNRQHVSADVLKNYLHTQQWQLKKAAHNAGPALEYQHADFAGAIGIIAPYSADFCASCNRLRVSSQGQLHLCLFGEQGYELRPYLSSGDIKGLVEYVQSCIQLKAPTHYLHQQQSGATKNFAMLGG